MSLLSGGITAMRIHIKYTQDHTTPPKHTSENLYELFYVFSLSYAMINHAAVNGNFKRAYNKWVCVLVCDQTLAHGAHNDLLIHIDKHGHMKSICNVCKQFS